MLRLGAVTVDRWRIGVGVGGLEPVTTRMPICMFCCAARRRLTGSSLARSAVRGEVERLIRESVMSAA
jgi:hypothetical protein